MKTSLNKFLKQKSNSLLYSPDELEAINHLNGLVVDATSELLKDENWAKILEIVDTIQSTRSHIVLKEVVNEIRLRLQDADANVVLLTLSLVESLVKNCGRKLHREIATEKFMTTMTKLHQVHGCKRGRDSLEISERVLDLVQAWGEAFLPHKRDLPLFSETYHSMRIKGIKFPDQYDESKAPVLSPPVSHHEQSSTDEIEKLTGIQALRVGENVAEMLEDMMDATETINGNDIIIELVGQCKILIPKMVSLIEESISTLNEENVVKYLALNDTMQKLVERYESAGVKKPESDQREPTREKGSFTGKSDDPDLDRAIAESLKFEEEEKAKAKKNEDDKKQEKKNHSNFEDDLLDFFSVPTSSKQSSDMQKKMPAVSNQNSSFHSICPPPRSATEKGIVKKKKVEDEDDPFADFVNSRAAVVEQKMGSQESKKDSRKMDSAGQLIPDLMDLQLDVDVLSSSSGNSIPSGNPFDEN